MDANLRAKVLKKNIVDYIIKGNIEDISSAVYTAENLLLSEGQRILIVDDSKTSRATLRLFFESLLFEVWCK